VRLEGSIDAFSLPDIFSLLSMTKKTGGLHLRRDTSHGVVWFTTGSVTGGAADITMQSLGRRLIGAGVVTDEALAAAVDRAGEEAIGVGRALHLGGTLDDGVVHDIASEHIVDSVFDLLRWPDGDFAFVIDEPNPDDVGVSRAVDDVVTEARNRLETWSNVSTTVPSPQTVLSFAANPPEDPQLGRDDWMLLALVDGRRTVAEIVGLLGRGDFAVVSGLADLIGRGLLVAGESDVVVDLTRRYDVLARLESGAPVVAAPVEVAPEPVVQGFDDADESDDADENDDDDENDDADDVEVDADDDELVANIDAPAEPAPTKPLASVAPQQRTPHVTPQRPEPVLPQRAVEFPEPNVPVAVAGGGATPMPAPAIERDPNVNKSLLLRLIAGVRGL
jgi:hypothetical protein